MNLKYSFLGALSVLALIGAGCTQNISLNGTSGFDSEKNEPKVEVLGAGSKVFAQWKDQTWYHGTINNICDQGFNVIFDDGNQKCVGEGQVFFDKSPKEDQLKVGSKVIAKWTGTAYYDAEVIKMNGANYTVRYYDKMERDVSLSELILDIRTQVRGGEEAEKGRVVVGDFKVGDKVVAEWVSADALYLAEIIGSCEKGVNVKYYDDAEKCLAENQILFDVAPTTRQDVGTKVLVRDSNTNNFFVGEITKVGGEGYEVKYNAYGKEETKDFEPENVRVDNRR